MQYPSSNFDYYLPSKSIKQKPYKNPLNSKLLIAETKKIIKFKNLRMNIKKNSVFVLNKSKVEKVRIESVKSTGGRIEFLILKIESTYEATCLIKSSDTKTIGKIYNTSDFQAKIIHISDGIFKILFDQDVNEIIKKLGKVPLPPYIKDNPKKYKYYNNQYSEGGFSVAAPTAGFHFTKNLINNLEQDGHKFLYVNLNVNIDTFKPIETNFLEDHIIHKEEYEIEEETFNKLLKYKSLDKNIICVGTTTLRAIESAYINQALTGETDLFIKPNSNLNIPSQLITNFHAPKSSLLSIVQCVYGDNWKDIYSYAINQKLKFLSFGDAVLFNVNE